MILVTKKSPILYVLLGLFCLNQVMPTVYAQDSTAPQISKEPRGGYQFEKDPNSDKEQEMPDTHQKAVDLDDVVAREMERQEHETSRQVEFWKDGEARPVDDILQFSVARDYKREVVLSPTKSEEDAKESGNNLLSSEAKEVDKKSEPTEELIPMTHGILKWNRSENHAEYLHKREDGTVKKFDYYDLKKYVMSKVSCKQPFLGNVFDGSICEKTEEVNKKSKLSFIYIDDFVEMQTPDKGEFIAITGKLGFKSKDAEPLPAVSSVKQPDKKTVKDKEENNPPAIVGKNEKDEKDLALVKNKIQETLIRIKDYQDKARAKQIAEEISVEMASAQVDKEMDSFRSSIQKIEKLKSSPMSPDMKVKVDGFLEQSNQYLEEKMSKDLEDFFDVKAQKMMFYDEMASALKEQWGYLKQMEEVVLSKREFEISTMTKDVSDMQMIAEQTASSILSAEEEENSEGVDNILERLQFFINESAEVAVEVAKEIKLAASEQKNKTIETEKQYQSEKENQKNERLVAEKQKQLQLEAEQNRQAELNQQTEVLLSEAKKQSEKVRENLMIFNAMADEQTAFEFIYKGDIQSKRKDIPDFLNVTLTAVNFQQVSQSMAKFNKQLESDAESVLMDIELKKKNIGHDEGEIEEKKAWFMGMSTGLKKWTENLSNVRNEMKNKLEYSAELITAQNDLKIKEEIKIWHRQGEEQELRIAEIEEQFSDLSASLKSDVVTARDSYVPLQFSSERSKAFDFLHPAYGGTRGFLQDIKAGQERYRQQIDAYKNNFSMAIKDYRIYLGQEKEIKTLVSSKKGTEEAKALEKEKKEAEEKAKKQLQIEELDRQAKEKQMRLKAEQEERAAEERRIAESEKRRSEAELKLRKLKQADAEKSRQEELDKERKTKELIENKRLQAEEARKLELERLEKVRRDELENKKILAEERNRIQAEKDREMKLKRAETLRQEKLEKERALELENKMKAEQEKFIAVEKLKAEKAKQEALEKLKLEKELEQKAILEEKQREEKRFIEEMKKKEMENEKLKQEKQLAFQKIESERKTLEERLLKDQQKQEITLEEKLKEQELRLRAEFEQKLASATVKPKVMLSEKEEGRVFGDVTESSQTDLKISSGTIKRIKEELLEKAPRYYDLEMTVQDKVSAIKRLLKQRVVLAGEVGRDFNELESIQEPQVIFGSKQNIKSFIDELKQTNDAITSKELITRIRSRSDYLLSNLKELVYVERALNESINEMLDQSLKDRKNDGVEIDLLLTRE